MKKSIAEISAETLRIESVLKELKSGEFISYESLEARSNVKMDNRGKGYLRTAFNRLKLTYSPVIGEGVELTGSENATQVVGGEVIKVDRAVFRADKKFKIIINSDYFKDINPSDKKDILCVGSMMETLRNHSKGTKIFFQKPTPPKALNS